MHRIITSTALALAVAFTSVPLTFSAASAQDVELQLGHDGPRLKLRDNCDPDREDCYDRRDRRDEYRRDDRDARRYDRGCTPDRALDKADRMGIRRARIADVGRRTIDVAGRSRNGNRVIVSFDRRDRRCGVVG
jgi:hypothetical protein